MEEHIIILGSNGQIGTELAVALRAKYGPNHVITSDIRPLPQVHDDHFELIDVLDVNALRTLFEKHKPTQIYLLAAMLSATGEKYPRKAWDLNMNGLLNVLDLAVEFKVGKVFWPSSIAVFGPHSPMENTPQYTVMDPNTIYGISKQAGERYCEYYHAKYGLDVRSIRYPGLISWKTPPGGGTTDYAIDIFHHALKSGKYTSFLEANTRLPMLYMDDAITGTIKLMDAPAAKIKIRSSYNVTGISFTPAELAESIIQKIPEFKIDYRLNDPRQGIANSWPDSINDQQARDHWGWNPTFGLKEITKTMLTNLS